MEPQIVAPEPPAPEAPTAPPPAPEVVPVPEPVVEAATSPKTAPAADAALSEDLLEMLRAARWYVSQGSGASKELLLDRLDRLLESASR